MSLNKNERDEEVEGRVPPVVAFLGSMFFGFLAAGIVLSILIRLHDGPLSSGELGDGKFDGIEYFFAWVIGGPIGSFFGALVWGLVRVVRQ
jgi:hypothetical protein